MWSDQDQAPRTTHTQQLEVELAECRRRVQELEGRLALATPSGGTGADSHPQAEEQQPALSREDIRRYSRQLILPELGVPGQLRLRAASILVVGAGGLGAPALLYLAAAGVGTLGVVDHDAVELSNLHRQVIHTEGRLGMSKSQSACASVTR